MGNLSRLSVVAGAMAALENVFMPTKMDYNQRSTRVLNYKKGGKPFTRGVRSKSLKTRANRRKSKAKSRG